MLASADLSNKFLLHEDAFGISDYFKTPCVPESIFEHLNIFLHWKKLQPL